jgi:holo-[acyl-carrier protein] synthase
LADRLSEQTVPPPGPDAPLETEVGDGPWRVLGVGIDAVDVARFRLILQRTPSFRGRCFTPGELAYAEARPDEAECLAARFAAKEATMKALSVGLGAFGFHDVEVVVDRGTRASGPPRLVLSGPAAELAASLGATELLVSLTHTVSTAQAIVLAQGVGIRR